MLVSGLLVGCVALALSGRGEVLAEDYVGQAFKRALITFALVRGINAVVSVVQGTEVAIEPAGVGVTLMTRSSIGDPVRTTEMRWRLVRRGLLLYTGGLLFDFVWPGTILPFYGAMFVLAALMVTLRIRWIALIGVAAAVAGWSIRCRHIPAGLRSDDGLLHTNIRRQAGLPADRRRERLRRRRQ